MIGGSPLWFLVMFLSLHDWQVMAAAICLLLTRTVVSSSKRIPIPARYFQSKRFFFKTIIFLYIQQPHIRSGLHMVEGLYEAYTGNVVSPDIPLAQSYYRGDFWVLAP